MDMGQPCLLQVLQMLNACCSLLHPMATGAPTACRDFKAMKSLSYKTFIRRTIEATAKGIEVRRAPVQKRGTCPSGHLAQCCLRPRNP